MSPTPETAYAIYMGYPNGYFLWDGASLPLKYCTSAPFFPKAFTREEAYKKERELRNLGHKPAVRPYPKLELLP